MKKILFLFAVFAFLQCSKYDGDIKLANCTIKYMGFVDSCDDYMIVIENEDPVRDIYYKPYKLKNDFKVENLQVKIKYILTEERHNCGFGGYVPIIHIIKIKKR